jgi:hypothetical protein
MSQDHTGFGKYLNFPVYEALYAILSCNPKHALGVLVHRANTFVELTRALTDIDSAGRSSLKDAASVCTDPKIVVAAIQHGVDGLVIDETINLDRYILEALAIEVASPEDVACNNTPSGRCAIMRTEFWASRPPPPVLLLMLRKS